MRLITFIGDRNETEGDDGTHYYEFRDGKFVHFQSIMKSAKKQKGRVISPAFSQEEEQLIWRPVKPSNGAPVPVIEAGATPWLQSDGYARA